MASEPPLVMASSVGRFSPSKTLKRCASAPPEREPPFKKLLDQQQAFFFFKRETVYPTPSPLSTPPPHKMAPIIGVQQLYAKQREGNVLVYLTPGTIYLVNFWALKKSAWLYHRMRGKMEDEQYTTADSELLPDAFDPGNLFGIEYFFILPPGSNRLRRVTRREFLLFLDAQSTSTAFIKTEQDEEISHMNTPKSSTPFQQPEANVQLLQAYMLLLHLMHDLPLPTFKQHFQLTFDAVKRLIDLCKPNFYDCMDLLNPAVNNYLLQHRQELFLAIKEDAPRFVLLAMNICDAFIMKEAMVHLAGTYHPDNWPWKTSKERLNKGAGKKIIDTVAMKAEELEFKCLKADRKLFLNSILVETENGESSRVDITNNKDSWAAVQIFRDWLAREFEGTDEDPVARGAVYRKLYRGGDAYLPTLQIAEMMKELGVGYDLNELAEDMDVIWGFARETVAQICKNEVMLDVKANGIMYLTSADIGDEDMPWYGNDTKMVDSD